MKKIIPVERELLSIIGEGAAREKYYCDSNHYMLWEENIAIPLLIQLGYEAADKRNPHFFNGDRDSFGPLMRIINVMKDGILYQLWYG